MGMDGGIPVFDGEGYEIWSKKMKTLFLSQELWDLVQQGYKGFGENSKLGLRECRKKDAKALYFIQQGVSHSIFPIIMEAKRSKEAWDAIRNKFHLEIVDQMTRENEIATILIDEMVSKLIPIYPERSIFRVPDALRHGSEEFYEPTVLAIGPYHRGKPRLASMEDQKIRNLKDLLNITGDQSVDRFVRAIMPHEEKVRKCYSEPIDYLSSNELVQMLVLDGCFIIQLFRRYWRWSESSKVSIVDDDPVINSSFLLIELQKDMLLIENQIPFFIIEILFNTIYPCGSIGNELKRLTLVFYYKRLKRYAWTTEDHTQLFGENVCHLLQIAHMVVCSDFTPATSQAQTQLNSFVYSATKLEEANVRLKTTSKLTRSIFDITFRKGELEIPGFNIDDDSEVEIRNFIAFELCQRPSNKRFFSHYVIFMDHLIASSDDVDLLTRRGIFNNQMIEAKSVDNMLSKLTRNIISSNYYTYNNISKDLNEYCERPWNKWSANLKQKYFNTPWAIISFIAALVLLGLTITQTLFSIISYK